MRKLFATFLTWLLNEVDPQFTALAFVFFDGKTTHKVNYMNTQLNDNGTTTLIAHCVSAAGNPAGTPTWTSSDTSIVNVTPAADGMSCTVVAVGKLGTATVTAVAGNLTATDDITVVAGPAVSLTLSESTLIAS